MKQFSCSLILFVLLQASLSDDLSDVKKQRELNDEVLTRRTKDNYGEVDADDTLLSTLAPLNGNLLNFTLSKNNSTDELNNLNNTIIGTKRLVNYDRVEDLSSKEVNNNTGGLSTSVELADTVALLIGQDDLRPITNSVDSNLDEAEGIPSNDVYHETSISRNKSEINDSGISFVNNNLPKKSRHHFDNNDIANILLDIEEDEEEIINSINDLKADDQKNRQMLSMDRGAFNMIPNARSMSDKVDKVLAIVNFPNSSKMVALSDTAYSPSSFNHFYPSDANGLRPNDLDVYMATCPNCLGERFIPF